MNKFSVQRNKSMKLGTVDREGKRWKWVLLCLPDLSNQIHKFEYSNSITDMSNTLYYKQSQDKVNNGQATQRKVGITNSGTT